MDFDNSSEVTHVIFDVDGTILDTESLYNKAKQNVLARFGVGHLFTKEMRDRTAGKQAQDVANIIVQRCCLPISPAEFTAAVDDEIRPMLSSTHLKPGVEKLITHLADHKVPVAIATSSRKCNSKLKMEGHRELFGLFNHKVFGSDDPEVTRGKPNPDIFLVAAKRFPDAPSPEHCLVIEDSMSGVQGALEAGMQVVMVPEHRVHPGATEVLPSLEEFNPAKYGLPAYEDYDESSRDSVF